MIEFKTGKCPKCNKLGEIILSNNPLSPGICINCLNTEIDYNNIKQADFFCRTYNIPFDPNKWIELAQRVGPQVFKIYTQQFFESDKQNLYHQRVTADLWGKLDEEWQQCRTLEQILAKVEPVKQKFMERNRVKWGANYNFEDYIKLENLLVSTLRANDITNPLQIDAIKKACLISLQLDKAIEAGDSKGIKELSSAYSAFTKTAQLDNVIAAANEDVITTVADLGEFIEQCGGEFKFYDKVERDIVDKTINDIKQYLRTLVSESTGLGPMLEHITETYKTSVEKQATDKATSSVTLEDIISDISSAQNNDFDKELENDTLDDVFIDGDDGDDYFG